jgi:hypothetical protein
MTSVLGIAGVKALGCGAIFLWDLPADDHLQVDVFR